MTDLNKLRSEFEKHQHPKVLSWMFFDEENNIYQLKAVTINEDKFRARSELNFGWSMWQKAKAQAVQQSFEIGRLQDRITELLDERQDLYAQINNDQAVPTWISVKDEEPPTDTMVLICWSDSPDVQPEIDYMTCDEDLNHIWANFYKDPPTHWMHFHKVPSESGAEQ
ncbi:DUF551 domain-containing protein [Acinetobacter baumannii]|uniref:DUF551 domain-containing protein n=1 Tax=Acinetobacter baumannii TaxID=470 RepID=UPI0022233E57|nr:DUF551 domain-containing protein [Acinetobacter baumannii]MCW1497023.1 DUF551 domain-containing protein [Acinetobacter baumannii]